MTAESPSDTELRSLFASSIDMMGIIRDAQLVAVNPAWEHTLGWPMERLIGEPFLDFIHADDRASMATNLDAADGDGTPDFESRFRHRDESFRTVEWSLRSREGSVYVGARDITARVALQHRVARSEAIAVAVLHTAVDPIIIISNVGEILHVNEATTTLFGYLYDEMVGENVSMLMPEPYRSQHDEYLSRYLREGDPRIIGVGREVEAQRADGTTFPMALAVSEAITEQDHLFTGIVRDLTERNRQRDELAAMNNRLEDRVRSRTEELQDSLRALERSNRDLEQFAYIASHDLQAPLRNVRQGIELLDEHLQDTLGQSLDEEATELRSLVVAAVRRMEDLIRGLLQYSRVQRESTDNRESVELARIAQEVLTVLDADVTAAGGTITVGDLPTVHADPIQMRQVLQNLVQNAIRYRSPDRPLAITVETDPRSDQHDHATIVIRDNGSGIEPAHHERIFELFRRGHSGFDGVGLGLAICLRILESHNGRIWVESNVDEGAAFFVQLPVG